MCAYVCITLCLYVCFPLAFALSLSSASLYIYIYLSLSLEKKRKNYVMCIISLSFSLCHNRKNTRETKEIDTILVYCLNYIESHFLYLNHVGSITKFVSLFLKNKLENCIFPTFSFCRNLVKCSFHLLFVVM